MLHGMVCINTVWELVSLIPFGYYTHIHVARSLTAYSFFFFRFTAFALAWACCLFIYKYTRYQALYSCSCPQHRECAATTDVAVLKMPLVKVPWYREMGREKLTWLWTQPCVDILDIYREFATLYTKRSSRFMSRGIPIYDAVTLGHCCHSHSAFRTVYYVVVVLEFIYETHTLQWWRVPIEEHIQQTSYVVGGNKASRATNTNNVLNSKRNKGNVIFFRNYLVNDDA